MTTVQQANSMHKKRLGQYFSGKKVADMLFSLLPEGREWKTVVDPMAGIGDMLISVSEHTSNTPTMLGIEIDEMVALECTERLPEATILTRDAFRSTELITSEGWELVITNPPYVRYQLQNVDDGMMPSAQEIRKNLIRQIKAIPYFHDVDKDLFLRLAKHYSGLADMAVPAWILCATLVKKGGYLAVVVPETWINRDYAGPIQYLLTKCFQIETIVRDTNASWFTEALVKTCLVIAKRKETNTLSNSMNLTTRIIESDREYTQPTASLFPHLKGAKENEKWVLDEDRAFFSDKYELPHELAEIIGKKSSVGYVSLSEMGIECGQGLRTGANEFFYVTIEKKEDEILLVRSKAWDQGGREYRFFKDDIILTLQNRGEIDGLVVSLAKLTTGAIYPQGVVQGELKKYIASAEEYRDAKGRQFKDFCAVRPNEKKEGERIVREWFRLPPMAQRHLPNLCLTRVSAKIPECLYVRQSIDTPIAIDANMVTLWSKDERVVRIIMAMLNSTWSKLSLELICTVMGGGALKIEASHLKKILLPKLPKAKLDVLERVGEELISTGNMVEEIQDQIDKTIVSVFGDESLIGQMRTLLAHKYKERSTRL